MAWTCRGHGALGGIRTPDPLVRSQVLYPTELPAQVFSKPASIHAGRIIGTCSVKIPSPQADGVCVHRFDDKLE